jgi:phosphoribosylamine---glycine ligase
MGLLYPKSGGLLCYNQARMKVLVLGDDGRAHAFVWKLFNSPQNVDIVCAPGNGGTSLLVPQADLDIGNAAEVARWAFGENVDLIVPASAASLRAGVVDEVVSFQIGVCGPSQRSTLLESSRCQAREFMQRHKLPVPNGRACSDLPTAEKYLAAQPLPVMVRADNPDVGGGVYHDRYSALAALRELFTTRPPQGSNNGVVIEEALPGFAVSLSAFTDGTTALPLLPVRLYDTLGPGEGGAPAPGMGAFTEVSRYSERLTTYLQRYVLTPLVAGLASEGLPYWGIIGVDCVIAADGPRLLSIRCALRDLEAQVVLPRLDDDLLPIIRAAITRRLHELPPLRWRQQASIGLGVIAQGYPHHFSVGVPISGLTELDPGVLVFHSHTDNNSGLRYERAAPGALLAGLLGGMSRAAAGTISTTNGHVLTVVALGPTLPEARGIAYRNAQRIQFAGRSFRPDVGEAAFGMA